MKVRLTEQNELAISLEDAFCYLNAEEKLALADTLSCCDDVIKNVADQIVHGWTEASSHGSLLCTATDAPVNGLDYAMRLVAKNAGEVAKTEIERLEKALAEVKNELSDLRIEDFRRVSGY